MKITCKHCDRYQFTATATTIQEEVPCDGCGAKSNYKIIFSDNASLEALNHRFTKQETPPKKLKKSSKV